MRVCNLRFKEFLAAGARARRNGFGRLAVLFSVWAAFFGASQVYAVDPGKTATQYVRDVWTSNDGLPQDSINAIAQTSDGYLWFGTQEGLVRFNGASFTVFDRRNSAVIDNFVFALYADENGTLWIGGTHGLGNYRDGGFSTNVDSYQKPFFSVKNLSGDSFGNLWLGNGDGSKSGKERGMVQYNRGGETFFSKDNLPSGNVNRTFTDSLGNLWIASDKGLGRLKDGALTVYTTVDGLSDDFVLSIGEDRAGDIWVGTENGLNHLKDGKFTVFTTREGLSDNRIRVLCADRDGNLWVGTEKGLNRLFDGRIFSFKEIGELAEDQILSLLEDREGSLWIGTHTAGLQRLRDGKFTPVGSPEGLLGDNANLIYEDRTGRMWIGTAPGGLNIIEDNRIVEKHKNIGNLIFNGASSIYEDRRGIVWIETRGGLLRFENGKFAVTPAAGQQAVDFRRPLYHDENNRFWIGTNLGLSVLSDGKYVHYTEKDGLAANDAKFAFADRSGRLWFGGGSGLTFFENDKFTPFRREEFRDFNFQSAIVDDEGVIWLTTWGQGLVRLKNDVATIFTSRDGLYDDAAWTILDDRRGNLWMSSNRGVFRVSKRELDDLAAGKIKNLTSVVYDTSDGMRKREGNAGNPSGWRATDGRLWFATTAGAVVIDPHNIKINLLPPPVVIEKIVADDRLIAVGEQNAELAAGTRGIEFHYAGLSFIAPERIRYKYKLAGFDADWIDAGTRREAFYTNLPPGDYTFTVIAANNDGIWNETGKSAAFRVLTPFWKTWWFFGLAALCVVAVIYLLFNRRVTALRRAHAAREAYSRQLIESQEQERQRIAVELHDGLGQSLVVIKNRALTSLNQPANHGRMLSQMTDISEAAQAAIAELREITGNLHPYQIAHLGLKTALVTMIKISSAAADIEISYDIDELAEENLSKQIEINLYRIAQEALNNVVKHAQATAAAVSLKITGRALELLITDDGRGFTTADSDAQKAGLGLTGIGERARILNARLEIRSAPENGTIVLLQMDLPPQNKQKKNENER